MAITAVTGLIRDLCRLPLLEKNQQEELQEQLQKQFPEPRLLLQELLRRRWLTAFQAKEILNGRTSTLLLGPYLLVDKLGEGGNGTVFKARHQHLNRIVALKVVRPELMADKQAVERFYREIEVVSQLSNPYIVHAFDAGPIGSALVLAMEFVDGTNLQQMVNDQGPLPVVRACDYIRQGALGLQHAHERGLVHRDVKPANLMVSQAHGSQSASLLKILDLGLARLHVPAQGSKTSNLTVLGGPSIMFGTPDYQAPEQSLDFHRADIRADLYSLGCTFYFLLTGHPPFEGTLQEKLLRHIQATPRPIEEWRADLPAELPLILKKLLAKQPAERYRTPIELAQALTTLLASLGPPPTGTDPEATATDQELPTKIEKLSANLPGLPAAKKDTAARRRRARLVLGSLLALLVVGIVSWLAVHGLSGGPPSSPLEGKQGSAMVPTTATAEPILNFANGFAASRGLTRNGSASINGTSLRLTSSNNQGGSVFTTNRIKIRRFKTTFDFRLQKPDADGFTFTIQGKDAKALGNGGAGLGYEGIGNSAAIKFDLYNNSGEGINSTGLYLKGAAPTKAGSIDLSGTGIDLHSEHPFRVTVTYDGTTLKVTIANRQTNASVNHSYPVDLVTVIGGETAFVGFTGGTGGASALQEILSWTFWN
jgi:serine/threonine protein kinase